MASPSSSPPLRVLSLSPAEEDVLHLRDAGITCVCPPNGPPRLAEDLIMTVTKSGITWMHRPCKPWAAAGENQTINVTSSLKDPVSALRGLLGPNPTAEQLTKAKNFATKFICDGCDEHAPRTLLKDHFMCKKCCAWQHKECMLYGEEGDVGGPVCNHCYMTFLLNYDAIRKWQRQRLMEAVQEAFMFLTDPETSHEVWRRAWLQKFFARFFAKVRELAPL